MADQQSTLPAMPSKKYGFPALLITAVFSLIAFGPVAAQSIYYDKYIHVRSLPSPPIAPKSRSECQAYAARLDQITLEIGKAHDTCLQVEKKGLTGVLADGLEKCSNPTCQDLHTARHKVRDEAENKKSACYLAAPVACNSPESRSCANKCDGDWGMLCPFTTVCDPVKHRCEKASP